MALAKCLTFWPGVRARVVLVTETPEIVPLVASLQTRLVQS